MTEYLSIEDLCNRVLALMRGSVSAWTLAEIANTVKQPQDRVKAALGRLLGDGLISQGWRTDFDRNCNTKVYLDRRLTGYVTCYAKRGN